MVCEVLFFCMQHLDMLTLSVFKATWGKKKRKKIYSRSNNSWLKANSKDELSKPLLSSTLSTNCSLSSSFCAQTKKNQSLKLSLYKTVINNCFETSWKCIETAGKDTFFPPKEVVETKHWAKNRDTSYFISPGGRKSYSWSKLHKQAMYLNPKRQSHYTVRRLFDCFNKCSFPGDTYVNSAMQD